METSYLILTVALVLFVGLLLWKCKSYMPHKAVYSFQDWEKTDMPYIHLNVQGHILNMIADSAASVSIIHKEALKGLTYEDSPRNVHLTAIDNEGIPSKVVTIPIHINDKLVKTDFVVYDSPIGNFIEQHGIQLHGILGVEFFRKTKGKVDFKKQTVTFS